MTRLGLVAGEPSGDLIASRLMGGLRTHLTDLTVQGIGGPALESAGMQIWHPMAALSVFGYVDALKSLPRLLRIYHDVARRWTMHPPDLFLGVDAPDFNLRLEHRLRRQGVPTVHFVGPSIWAWRYERIQQIRQAVSHMLVLFPFEVEIYEKEGIPVTYVGHPLADAIPADPDQAGVRQSLGLHPDGPVVAILPGSRSSEVRLLSPVFLQTAAMFARREPETQFIVPMVNDARRHEFEAILEKYPVPNLRILQASKTQDQQQWPVSWQAMAACNIALVASGTATLETALFKRPMVISYILSSTMRRIMALKSGQKGPSVPWVGLPNVLSQAFVVPELLQDAATPLNLFDALDGLWRDEARKRHIQQQFEALHKTLRCNTAQRASEAIYEILQNPPVVPAS